MQAGHSAYCQPDCCRFETKDEVIVKCTTALCLPEQKLNSEPAGEVRSVSPACIDTFVSGSLFDYKN